MFGNQYAALRRVQVMRYGNVALKSTVFLMDWK